jgi:hypothetical protein
MGSNERAILDHLKHCDFYMLPCTGCKELVVSSKMEDHMVEQCPAGKKPYNEGDGTTLDHLLFHIA